MAIIACFFFGLIFLMAFAPEDERKTYAVKKITKQLTVTGKGDDPLWNDALQLDDFVYPWEADTPPLTSFKALHNDDWLYCLFDVHDDNINVYVHTNEKRESVRSDRVEIFLKKDDKMSPYYCLEIDALARVFDCTGEFYRMLDAKWSWPAGHLVTKSFRKSNGYSVEIAISKQSLNDLGLINDSKIQAGLYRADCVSLNNDQADFRWISWVRPDSSNPDFHIPSSFGTLQLE